MRLQGVGSAPLEFSHPRIVDIYRFTLYWHLILMVPLFVLPGVWAVAMLAVSTVRSRRTSNRTTSSSSNTGSGGPRQLRGTGSGRRTSWYSTTNRASWYRSSDSGPSASRSLGSTTVTNKPAGRARKRVLLLAALVIPLLFGLVGAVIAFVLSACIGYALVGVYEVTGFHISTWIPFLWSLLQTIMIILGCVGLTIL